VSASSWRVPPRTRLPRTRSLVRELLNLARTHPIFRGVPTLELQLADGLHTRVPQRELEWRASSHSDSWAPSFDSCNRSDRPPLPRQGRAALVGHRVGIAGHHRDRAHPDRRPRGCRSSSAAPTSSTLTSKARLTPTSASCHTGQRPHARGSCRTSGPVATPLTLAVVCKNGHTLRLSLPFPGIDLYFVDAAGHRLPDDATLFLGHLGGIAAQVTGTATSLSGARLDASLQTGQFRHGAAAETLLIAPPATHTQRPRRAPARAALELGEAHPRIDDVPRRRDPPHPTRRRQADHKHLHPALRHHPPAGSHDGPHYACAPTRLRRPSASSSNVSRSGSRAARPSASPASSPDAGILPGTPVNRAPG
jgi:hypothetical protein